MVPEQTSAPARPAGPLHRSPFALLLALQQLWLLWGFDTRLDLHPDDEIKYLASGLELASGNPGALDLAYSPLTSVLYAILALVPHGSLALPDIMFVGLAIGSVLVVFWALRARYGDFPAALAAALWGQTPLCLHFVHGLSHLQIPSVYVLGFSLVGLALGMLLRGRLPAALCCMLLAAANRPEYLAWLLVFAGLGCLGSWRSQGDSRRDLRAWTIALAVGAALLVAALAVGGERSFFAFSQHYAQARARSPEETLHAFTIHEQITRRDFPSATSLPGLLAENPRAFLEHLWHNLGSLWQIQRVAYLLPASHWMPWTLFCLAAVVGLGLRRSAHCRTSPIPQLRIFILGSGTIFFAATCLGMRPDHLMPLILWPLLLLAHGLNQLGTHIARPGGLTRALGLALLAGLTILAHRPPALPPERLPLRNLRGMLLNRPPPAEARLTGPFGRDLETLLERRPGTGPVYWVGPDRPTDIGFELVQQKFGVGVWRQRD